LERKKTKQIKQSNRQNGQTDANGTVSFVGKFSLFDGIKIGVNDLVEITSRELFKLHTVHIFSNHS